MSAPIRIAAFVAALVGVFALALVLGRAIGPIGADASNDADMHHESAHPTNHGSPSGSMAAAMSVPGGLMVSSAGYTFDLADGRAKPGGAVPISFRITGPGGEPITAYDVEHDKQLHFIAVRRDLTGFQHLHPVMAGDGTWSTDVALTAGDWRLFADFKPTGADALTLGADLAVAGKYLPVDASGDSRTSTVDGYQVTIAGALEAGTDSRLTATVSKDGKPVTDLQPYLGAYGHLVAFREGDLAYLHVHTDGMPGDGTTKPGPDVVFFADVPSAGGYRLFLNFQHAGVVRTASFALTADPGTKSQDMAPSEPLPSASMPSESGHSGH